MKKTFVAALFALLVTGCAAFEEAYYIDREFGQASQAAWDRQIVSKNQPYGDQPAEGLAGITAEEIIQVHNKAFAEKPTKANVLTIEMTGNK
jgi:hypothetical protein